METRMMALRARLAERGADALFSLDPPTNAYLTGFRGSTSAVLVTARRAVLLCDFRYTEQAQRQAPDSEVVEITGTMEGRVGEWLSKLGSRSALFEPDRISFSQHKAVHAAAPGVVLTPVPGLVEELRQIKDADETAKIRRACQIAESALAEVVDGLRAGVTERETAARLEHEFKRRGAQRASFDTIALFGARSSLPHGEPTDKALEQGDIVLIDCGCVVDGYCSDLTRTFFFGRIPGDWAKEIYLCVQQAQQAAVAALHAGASASEVDAAARNLIARAGFGARFGHGTGHSVGIEVHENPRLNALSKAVLAAGMAVTVEPGIYLPGRGGVRIEDLAVVTDSGCDILTAGISKDLQVIGK
jgi:Xaa-Pro aminopeptidase